LEYIVVSVLNGVVHGLLLFMVSAGLTLIFGMMGALNFAHAWFYMLGAYVGFTLTRLGGFWIGLLLAPIIAGLAGVLVERYMLRRVHKYGHAHELLLTFGLAFIIIKLFYGDALVSYQMPNYMRFAHLSAISERAALQSGIHPAGPTKPWRSGDGFACRAAMSVDVATGRRSAALSPGNEPQHDDMTREVLAGVRIRAVAG
jgi:hypothetical protein